LRETQHLAARFGGRAVRAGRVVRKVEPGARADFEQEAAAPTSAIAAVAIAAIAAVASAVQRAERSGAQAREDETFERSQSAFVVRREGVVNWRLGGRRSSRHEFAPGGIFFGVDPAMRCNVAPFCIKLNAVFKNMDNARGSQS
jgi:hypothetical protein